MSYNSRDYNGYSNSNHSNSKGENFDKTGMVVTATYNDGTTSAVEGYTVTNGTKLTAGQTSVKISYTENGVTIKNNIICH